MSEYSLDFKKHKKLLDKIINGEITLFTGAGFSIDSTVRREPILTSSELIKKIITELLEENNENDIKRIQERKTFQQICQQAINHVTEDTFNEFLVRNFRNAKPKSFHTNYSLINWKNIFTLNIDDLLENIYKDTDVELQVYDTKKMPLAYVGDNILRYYKLHGNVNNKSEKFVFASTQYLNKLSSNEYNYNYTKFSECLYHDTICMIGTNLNEIDLDVYIERFGKGMGESIPKEKIYYVTRKIYKEDISELERRNIICIEETTESFINKVIEYLKINKPKMEIEKKPTFLKIIKKVSFDKKMENLGFNIEKKLAELYSKEEIKTHKAIQFYTGFAPKWIDIIAGSDAILENTTKLINSIDINESFKLFLLLGKSGNGKSTNLKRIIYNYSTNTDYIVLSHNEHYDLIDDTAKKLAEEFNKLDKKIILTFDNGSWAFNFISVLYKYIKEDLSLSILISSRIPEYYREMRNLQNIPTETINYDKNINEQNAKKLILKLEEKSYLGDLANFNTMDKKIKYFLTSKQQTQKDLFSCLIHSIKGNGHYKKLNVIINDKMREKENANYLLVLSIFDSFGSFPLPLQLYLDIFQNEITNLRKTVSECSDLLNNSQIQSYENLQAYIRPRGSFVTNKIISNYKNYFSEEDVLNITKKILMYITSNYNVNYNKGKNLFTELTHNLLVSKYYYQNFQINDKPLFDKFYYSLTKYFSENSDFWLQYAKMEMKLGDLPSAKIHLDQASALNPYSYKILHTIGQWHFFNACNLDNYNDALIEFQEGEQIMLGQLKINDAYPVHTYIDGFMEFHKKFNFKLEDKKIRELYNIIKDSLEKFHDHSLLLIIWKKFYLFLEKENKTKIISIPLNEYKKMTSIDINKSAEEQYSI